MSTDDKRSRQSQMTGESAVNINDDRREKWRTQFWGHSQRIIWGNLAYNVLADRLCCEKNGDKIFATVFPKGDCVEFLTNISQTMQDSTIVSTEDEYELVCNLSSGTILMSLSDPSSRFQGRVVIRR